MQTKCGHLEAINEKLSEHDQAIEPKQFFSLESGETRPGLVLWATRYTKAGNPKRGKYSEIHYCPWCGEKLEWVEDNEEESQPEPCSPAPTETSAAQSPPAPPAGSGSSS